MAQRKEERGRRSPVVLEKLGQQRLEAGVVGEVEGLRSYGVSDGGEAVRGRHALKSRRERERERILGELFKWDSCLWQPLLRL